MANRSFRRLGDYSSDEVALFVGQEDHYRRDSLDNFELDTISEFGSSSLYGRSDVRGDGAFDDYNSYSNSEDDDDYMDARPSFRRRRKPKQGFLQRISSFCSDIGGRFIFLCRTFPCFSEPVFKDRTFSLNANRHSGFASNVVCNQKYNIITFLPIVLYEQFKFFFNLYFLLVAISQFVPSLKIGYLYTYWGPLIFVLAVTITKEALDDIQRYRRDLEVNGAKYKRLTADGVVVNITSSQIQVGDVIVIDTNQRVPADCILLRTTEKSGACFIRTDQLDGETDWKLRIAISSCQKLETDEEVYKLGASIFADQPIKDIHSFVGTFTCPGDEIDPLSIDNTMWANTVVAAGTALCCVIYTGKESRSVMNTNQPSSKTGLLDDEINVFAKMLFVLTMVLAFVLVALKGFGGAWYIYLFRFILLFSYIIPISLRVNLDMGKTVYAYFIENDDEIPETIVRTSSIPEELGRIQYLLSDKTGTLTQNEMIFKKLHMGTVSFGTDTFCDVEDGLLATLKTAAPSSLKKRHQDESLLADNSSSGTATRIRNVVAAIATCHNVTPVYEGDEIVDYQAASPDEVALVKWTASVGLKLIKRDLKSITLEVSSLKAQTIEYDILGVFPFTSETKRMGIIVRDKSTNEIFFYQKGADAVMSKIVQYNDWLDEECGNMSREGLRTLVVARRQLTEDQFRDFNTAYKEAKRSVVNRNENVQQVIETLEYDLELLGVTGVEDKLQEDIKPTLELLRNAGVHIWMLTGDKVETATCIAISSRLVSRNQTIFQFGKVSDANDCYRELDKFSKKVDCALVIDGHAIKICLQYLEADFVEIASKAPAVVCCRCSPTQKADIVNLIKVYTGVRTCAIGDGGNDVSMIQAADVGIGIVGKEGKQASLAADISITQFKHIAPLLIWHGRNSYKRSSALAQFVIHRGLIISVIQAVFSAVFYFSAIALYQGLLMVGYATFFTMFPVFSLVLDEDVSRDLTMMYPELYKELTKGRALTLKTFFSWVLISTYQGTAIMLGALLVFDSGDFIHIVSISFTSLILTELLMVAFTVNKFHWMMIVAEFISLAIYVVSIFVLTTYFDIRFVATWSFLWKVTAITVVSCLPLVVIQQVQRRFAPPAYSKLT